MVVAALSKEVSSEYYFPSQKKEDSSCGYLGAIALGVVSISALSYFLMPSFVHQLAIDSVESQVGCLTHRCRVEKNFEVVLKNGSVDSFITFLRTQSINPFRSKLTDNVTSFIRQVKSKSNVYKVINAISLFCEIPDQIINQLFASEFHLSYIPSKTEELLAGLIRTSSQSNAVRFLSFLKKVLVNCSKQYSTVISKLIALLIEQKEYEALKVLYKDDVSVNTPVAKKSPFYPYYNLENPWVYAVRSDFNLLKILLSYSKNIENDVNQLVECGSNDFFFPKTKMSPLALAILGGNKKAVELLIEKGAGINYVGDDKQVKEGYIASPLAAIIRKEATEYLKLLQPRDIPDNIFFFSSDPADLSLRFKGYQKNGEPVSVFRAYFNQLELFTHLFALNPKIVTFRSSTALTALQSAIDAHRFDIAYLHLLASRLKEKEDSNFEFIRINPATKKTLLHQMVQESRNYVSLFMADAKENGYLNAVDLEGNTPITLALINHNMKWVQELINEDAVDLDVENNNGVTARKLIENADRPYLNLLLSRRGKG